MLIDTGVKQGERRSETLSLENKGLVPGLNVALRLLNQDGSATLPPWIYLASSGQLGNLELGKKQTVQIDLAPDGGVSDGVYNFRLRVTADNGKRPTAPPSPQRFYCGILWRKGRSSSRRRWGQVGSFSSVALSQA